MSEVKPTLVQPDENERSINSWLDVFPTGTWAGAQTWITINTVRLGQAYEYRIKFDNPVENITLRFPFVVKTSDNFQLHTVH